MGVFGERAKTYQGRAHWHGSPLIPRLHDGGVDALDRVGQAVEVAGDELVRGEVRVQDVEELQEARGDVLWGGEVLGEGQGGAQVPEQARAAQGVVEGHFAGGVADAQEARGDGVEVFGVEFVEIAF